VPVDRRVGIGLVRPFTVRPVSGVWARVDSRPVPPRAALDPPPRFRDVAVAFRARLRVADAFRVAAPLVAPALRVDPRFGDVLRRLAEALRADPFFAVVVRAGRFLAGLADFRVFARFPAVCFRAVARPRPDAVFFAEPRF